MPQAAARSRMSWLDANRVFAAVLVIMIHSTTDISGQPFTYSEPSGRFWPLIIRWVSESASSELFLLISLFLLALKFDREPAPYGRTVTLQASRLLVPFVAWTVFYAFFRLVKANAFGYTATILHELSQWPNWVGYFFLGSAQYHLHFNPTLFALMLFYPLYEAARRFPAAGFAIVPLLFVLDAMQGYIWGHVSDPLTREFFLRGAKILTYSGYGLAAFGFYGLFKAGLNLGDWRLVRGLAFGAIVISLMCVFPSTYDSITTGQWGARGQAANYGHFLMPLFVFAAFLSSQAVGWSPVFSRLARYTYGVYLIHPAFIDIWDAGVKQLALYIDPTAQVFAKWTVGATGALGTTVLLSRVKALAWLVGLGPVPFAGLFGVAAEPRAEGKAVVA